MGTEHVICGLKVESEAIGKDLDGFISSLPGFTVEKNVQSGRWDLLVIEVNGNADRELDFAREALASHITKNIFFTSSQMDPKVLIEALKIGAKGFFRQPIDFNEVRETLMRIREEKKARRGDEPVNKGKIIYAIGSKGGAGTSTVAANLAMSLASMEGPDAAAFIDVNEVFGDAPLLFGIERPVDWVEISKHIRENGGSIPGIRSEKMEEYLSRILYRIILPGSLFLAFIAIIPSLVQSLFHFPTAVAYLMGGTSLLILVGVDLDTMSQIEGYLRMHHHDGIVKRGKIRSRNL